MNAPQGRWQKNKDIHWYSRGEAQSADDAAAQKRAEMQRLKDAEEEALSVALGFAPNKKAADGEGGVAGVGTGANGVAVGKSVREEEIERLEKEEKRKEKE